MAFILNPPGCVEGCGVVWTLNFILCGLSFFALVRFLYHCRYYSLCCFFHQSVRTLLNTCSLYTVLFHVHPDSKWSMFSRFPLIIKLSVTHFEFKLIVLVQKQLFPNTHGCPIWGISDIFNYVYYTHSVTFFPHFAVSYSFLLPLFLSFFCLSPSLFFFLSSFQFQNHPVAFLKDVLAMPHGTWDISSPTRDWTLTLCIGNVES